MPSIVKKLAAAELREAFKDSDSVLVVGVDGLDMPQNEALRTQLAEHGMTLRVVPNKLARAALADCGFEFGADVFQGPIAVTCGDAEAAINAAKVFTSKEVKKAGKVTVRAGALEGVVLGAADAAALADVPDKNSLRSMILGCLSGPAQQLVGILAAPQGSVARVLQAKVDAGVETPAED
jgi:large subunit ribosomal protein L10